MTNKKILWHIFLLFLFLNLLVGGGRLPSSDETSCFLLTESIATRGRLDIPPGIVENGSFWGDKFYSWYEVGLSLFAVPFYYAGSIATKLLPLPGEFNLLIVKAAVATFNAFVGGFLAVLFFSFSRKLGYSTRVSFFLTLGLCMGTNLFPYLKSFLREPILSLFLLGSFYFLFSYKLDRTKTKWLALAGLFAGLGFLTKVTFAMNILFLLGYFFVILTRDEPLISKENLRRCLFFFAPMSLGFLGILLYNYLRFSDFLELGYRGGTSFPTPLFVGLYGLLFSSGKSVFLYAPLTLLLLWSFVPFHRSHKAEAIVFLCLLSANLILYAKYISWAGEGSWGPRYLIPVLPFAVLPIGILLQQKGKVVKFIAIGLTLVGVFVQVGGLAIYLGNYYREIGEYPYKRNFDDPEFMYKSHFIPNYSPVVGHWRMLLRNLSEHLRGEIPQISFSQEEQLKRIPLQPEEQKKLFHTFDFWFMYPRYAGFKLAFPLVALFALVVAVALQGRTVWRIVDDSSQL